MGWRARTWAGVITALCATAIPCGAARAGTYYVYACSSFGNTAPAFSPYSNADHLNTANGCMEPAPGGGYRSLEINNPRYEPVLQGYGANWTAYSPSPALSIVGAYTPVNTVFVDCNLHADGFTAEFLWSSGTQDINHVNGCNSEGYGFGTGIDNSFAPSSYFGWGAGCWLASSCATSSNINAVLGVQGVRLTVEEDSGPSVNPTASDNIWFQGGGWVRGGGWPVSFSASDPSGVCATDLAINGQTSSLDNTSNSPVTSNFTQCWPSVAPADTLDTRSFGNGPLWLMYEAVNAASVFTDLNQIVQVDNTPVSLSLSTPNDGDPNAWVNHAVKVTASASAGPSGLRDTSCSNNGGASYGYPSGGITLDGTGVWTVACSSENNAVDVNGQLGSSSTESVRVHIDETPPSVRLEAADPADPQAVVADTSDAQSGVSGGQIEIRPAGGGSWDPLATRFDGAHLLARFDDALLSPGPWVIQASSCDHAGNCASAQETVTLPVRVPSDSSVGFGKLADAGARCHLRGAGRRHHRRAVRVCSIPHLQTRRLDISFTKRPVLRGVLTTAQGLPVGGAAVSVLTAPDDGLAQYTQVASATTNSDGVWTVALDPGPSRLITAAYAGSPTIQPSQATARLFVPAPVRVLRVWPRHVAWGGKVHVRAQLLGGFLPAGGALVRLRLGYGSAKVTYGVREHVGGNGTFEVTNTFGPGPPTLVRHFWLQECTLPEGDYPFVPSCGPRSAIIVGGRRS